AAVAARWPGREPEVEALADLMGEGSESTPPLFVHGPPGAGKTSVLCDLVESSGCRWIYVDCSAITTSRALLASMLEQLEP
ncbi:unnamed protein product, partial [Phaeothamnion confervicola]